jgi:hypothetical protein
MSDIDVQGAETFSDEDMKARSSLFIYFSFSEALLAVLTL